MLIQEKNLPPELILHQMQIGPMDNFQYFLGDATTKEIAVVDPAWDVGFLCDEIKKCGYKVTAVFLTHGHMDHVNGLSDFLKNYDVPAYISKHEAPFYKPKHKNIKETEDKEKLSVGSVCFECILMPGHSPGCQAFKYKNMLIAGDVVFVEGCGRCDLPGGDPRIMYDSLYEILLKMPDETVVFCGHDYGSRPYASLAFLKEHNPYLNCKSKDEFLIHRMGFLV